MTTFTDTYTAALDAIDLLPWWAHWLSGTFAVIGALLPFRWLLAGIPIAGPILLMAANAVVGVLKLIAEVVIVPYLKLLGQGIYRACTSLPGITVAITGGMVFVIVGIVIGVRLDAHLVREANGERDEARLERDAAQKDRNQWKGRLNEQETRAGAAEQAAKLAEDKVRAALAARDRAQRLLNAPGGGAAKAGPAPAAGSGGSGFPAVLWGGK